MLMCFLCFFNMGHIETKTRQNCKLGVTKLWNEWQSRETHYRLEVGIVTVCTISVILFTAAMHLLVRAADVIIRRP